MTSVLFVTEDIDGNTINSGIGTYVREISYLLKSEGFDVSILVERKITCKHIDEYYTSRGINVYFVEDVYKDRTYKLNSAHWILRRSHLIYNAIKSLNICFDIIEFPEFTGSAFVPLRMKKYCGEFQNTILVVKMHGYLSWHIEGMHNVFSKDDTIRDYIDKYCIENADIVLSPSEHMIQYTRDKYGTSRDILLVRNPINDNAVRYEFSNQNEIVFFGRLEERKGVLEFIDAVKTLNPDIPVTFVGMSASLSKQMIKEMLYGYNVSFYTGSTRDDALKYVANHAKFAVIPSRLDNYPTTIIECIRAGIPFVTVNTGGIPEMIGLLKNIISSDLSDLSQLLQRAYTIDTETWSSYIQYLQDNLDVIANHDDIIRFYSRIIQESDLSLFESYQKPVTLLMPYRNGSKYIKETLDSLVHQSYKNFELIVIDDSDPEESEYLKSLLSHYPFQFMIFKGNHISVGNALNQGLDLINTDYFIQIDGDNLFRPDMVQTYINAAYNNPDVDVLTSYNDAFGDWDQIYYPVGPIKELLPVENVYGDACAIYKTSKIKEIKFPDTRGIIVDWAMWNKMVNLNCNMDVIPMVLVDYRALKSGHSSKINHTNMYKHNLKYLENPDLFKLYGMILNSCYDNEIKGVIDFIKNNKMFFKIAYFVGYKILKKIF